MRRIAMLAVLAFASGSAAAFAGEARRLVVVELFTSEGCSSCPPADAFLAGLVRDRPDVLPLAFHVTYWNGLGWHDPWSLDASTARQRMYAAKLPPKMLYTPQMVVDGRHDVIGSESESATAIIRDAAAQATNVAALQVARDPAGLSVSIGEGRGQGTVWLIGYDPLHRTAVARGENGGQELTEANIVRSVANIGAWHGARTQFQAPVPAGERIAVIVQAEDGTILAAQRLGS